MKQIHWERALEAPTEQFHDRLLSVLNALPEQEEMTMKHLWNAKRIGALAVAAVLVLSIGVAAANNLGFMRSDWKNSRSLKDAAAVEEVLKDGSVDGITEHAKFLESYSNGFTFVKGNLEGTEARGDNNPTVYHYQSVSSWYERDGATVYVDICPVLPGVNDAFNGTAAEWGDVTLYTLEQDYKIVPEDYEPTSEEKAAEAAGTLVFSWDGSLTQPEMVQQRYVSWMQDGMRYSVNSMDSMTELSELVAMAQELINS